MTINTLIKHRTTALIVHHIVAPLVNTKIDDLLCDFTYIELILYNTLAPYKATKKQHKG